MSRDPITEERIDVLLAVAGSYQDHDTLVPLSVETDLMREGVFLSHTHYDKDTNVEDET